MSIPFNNGGSKQLLKVRVLNVVIFHLVLGKVNCVLLLFKQKLRN